MGRRNPKTGLPYVTGVKFAAQDSWKVTAREIANQIRANPDLSQAEKAKAIAKMSEVINGNTRAEGMALLNRLYQKAWGSGAHQQSPLATFVKESLLRRGKY